ncbi:hypothetical protein J437_LFUL009233 [Ladona fulva]|uniref:Chitin-binding type-2 domain-containing protein n=1 Tax=Ladona fulva TaxID=123851 RepID=A0A8K0K781_LADFU|nr:hypothetical protein J437_LFUL009233 [Ladona fulva]
MKNIAFLLAMGGIIKKNVILGLTIVLAYATSYASASGCQNANCPAYNGTSTIVPNPDECESFCVCTCDGAIYMPCPAGLHYNKECHMCDWPSHAGCDPSGTTKPPPVTPPKNNGCDKVQPLCPSTNTGNATLLPNPDDCGSYCACDWGNAIWMPCPPGLHFNPTLKVCDYPDHAGCEPGPPPPPTTTTKDPTTVIDNGCGKVKPFCPPTNIGNATLLPNPDDCGSYCVCDWGNAVWMPCPAGLHFNPVLKVCDWPANAGCEAPATTPRPHPTSTRPPPPPPGNCNKVKPLCPPTNEGNATLLPNPDDCGSYCVCDWGNAIWMPCPAGLHFNPVLKVCDWPADAGCDGSASTPRPPITTTRPNTNPGKCDNVKPLCPPTNEGNATLLPNPDDCGSYCVCDWGNAIWMPCPAGLHFNPVLKTTNTPPHGRDGCYLVADKCPVPENPDHATLLANPWDPRSYCKCDWGKVHWMPCDPGTVFNEKLQVCI